MKRFARRSLTLLIPASAIGLLGACGGDSQSDTTPAATTPATASAASGGEQLYQQRCITCHQADGRGIPGSFPPLVGSEYANASNPAVPILIVINGIAGPLTVHGQQYNGLMPPYGVGIVMSDEEVASLLTYVRTSWGNQASQITAEDVARVRAMPRERTGSMTAEELAPLM
jgi:mono/diheme cytochrome c family protein